MSIKIQNASVRREEGFLLKDEETKCSVLLLWVAEGILVCEGGLSSTSKDFWSFLNKESIEDPIIYLINDSKMNQNTSDLITRARELRPAFNSWVKKNYNYAEQERNRQEAERLESLSESDNFPYDSSVPPF